MEAKAGRHRKSIEERLYEAIGGEWGGNTVAPAQGLVFTIEDYGDGDQHLASVNEDAGTLWIGTMHRWHTHMGRKNARRLAWFILWRWWAVGEWFGLRRWIWHRLLFRRVNRFRVVQPGPGKEATDDGE